MSASAEPITRLETLRAGTRLAHAQISTVPALARLLAADLTRAEYVSALQHLHAFHVVVEPAICAELAHWPDAASMLDGARPRALADDLSWFGAPVLTPLPPPVLEGTLAALGALYVIEGSGLGGRVIAKHLTDSVGISMGAGGSFFCRQDADTARRRWHRLMTLLESPLLVRDAAGTGPVPEEAILEGALASFRYLECWMRTIKTSPQSAETRVMAEAVGK